MTSGSAPFTKGIVFMVSLLLMVPGLAYGIVIGRYKSDKDVWADISQGFSEMGNYIFMCFFISIFTNFFAVSKLGTVLAIAGADGLKSIGFTGVPLMIGLIIVSCFVNLFIGSGEIVPDSVFADIPHAYKCIIKIRIRIRRQRGSHRSTKHRPAHSGLSGSHVFCIYVRRHSGFPFLQIVSDIIYRLIAVLFSGSVGEVICAVE